MATNPKYSCPLEGCSYQSTNQHLVRHIKGHDITDIRAKSDDINIRTSMKNPKNSTFIKIKGDRWFVCYGCNKFWARAACAKKHIAECENRKAHCDFIATIFPKPEDVPEGVANDETILKLQAEIKKLTLKVKNLEIDVADNEIKAAAWDIMSMALYKRKDVIDVEVLKEWCKEESEDSIHAGLPEVEWDDFF